MYDIANQITVYGSNANVQMVYDSTNNYYIFTNSKMNSTGFVPIKNMVGLDNIRLEADIYINYNGAGLNFGLGLLNPSVEISNIGNANRPLNIHENGDHLITGSTTQRVWSKLIVEVRGNTLNITLKKVNGTVNCSTTYTMQGSVSQNTQYGLNMFASTTNPIYVKNIIIERL